IPSGFSLCPHHIENPLLPPAAVVTPPIHQMGVSSHNTKKHHSVLSDRCAAFLECGEYQNARRDAIDALKLDPNNIKYWCHLSKALLGLHSYITALQELQYLKDSADDNVKSLLHCLPI